MQSDTKAVRPASVAGIELLPDDFDPVPLGVNVGSEIPVEESIARRRIRVFCSNKVAVFALILLVVVAIFGFLGPLTQSASYDQVFRGEEKLAPCATHLFGTDEMGRDMLVRCMYGVRISLSVGLITAAAVLVIGCAYGSLAGYCGGRVDLVLMRIVEIVDSLPAQLVVLLMAITLKSPIDTLFEGLPDSFITQAGSGMFCILIAFSLLYWTGLARIVRSSVLQLKNEGYAMSARSMGAKGPSVVWHHLLPNSLSLIVVEVTQLVKDAIFSEAFLSFIGMGVSVPMASLGTLINNARTNMLLYPYEMIEPTILIFVITWSLYVIADALEDAFDPRML
ncbi:oligopeptide transport system permease protein [Olsenella sp. KH3B4]|uniref:ABC transporter permease n=1 Tax=Olsenella sp. KH3B4 TaxID=1855394 RepID=UPI0008D64A3C|nr:ABC transporter permease [Olsenella sp. KH3B4]SET00008.1 oligopeptide transport system permease protein [Olsenella sp. KH3B4]